MRILCSGIALKDIFVTLKITAMILFTFMSKQENDLAILRGFHFHETIICEVWGK